MFNEPRSRTSADPIRRNNIKRSSEKLSSWPPSNQTELGKKVVKVLNRIIDHPQEKLDHHKEKKKINKNNCIALLIKTKKFYMNTRYEVEDTLDI